MEILQYGGWVGTVILGLLALVAGRKFQRSQTKSNEADVTRKEIENTRAIIEIWKTLSDDQNKEMEKLRDRVGLLENKLKERDLEHQRVIELLKTSHETKVVDLEYEYKEKYKELEELYEEKLATIEENYTRKVEQIEESYNREVTRLQEDFRKKCEECEQA